ncbi:MAG: hypothetical protein C4346_16610 [Chloroflexota bacterium]
MPYPRFGRFPAMLPLHLWESDHTISARLSRTEGGMPWELAHMLLPASFHQAARLAASLLMARHPANDVGKLSDLPAGGYT